MGRDLSKVAELVLGRVEISDPAPHNSLPPLASFTLLGNSVDADKHLKPRHRTDLQ